MRATKVTITKQVYEVTIKPARRRAETRLGTVRKSLTENAPAEKVLRDSPEGEDVAGAVEWVRYEEVEGERTPDQSQENHSDSGHRHTPPLRHGA